MVVFQVITFHVLLQVHDTGAGRYLLEKLQEAEHAMESIHNMQGKLQILWLPFLHGCLAGVCLIGVSCNSSYGTMTGGHQQYD